MGWEQLKTILDQNREDARREAQEPPEACPIDGARLNVRGDNARSCPMGNYVWRGGSR